MIVRAVAAPATIASAARSSADHDARRAVSSACTRAAMAAASPSMRSIGAQHSTASPPSRSKWKVTGRREILDAIEAAFAFPRVEEVAIPVGLVRVLPVRQRGDRRQRRHTDANRVAAPRRRRARGSRRRRSRASAHGSRVPTAAAVRAGLRGPRRPRGASAARPRRRGGRPRSRARPPCRPAGESPAWPRHAARSRRGDRVPRG